MRVQPGGAWRPAAGRWRAGRSGVRAHPTPPACGVAPSARAPAPDGARRGMPEHRFPTITELSHVLKRSGDRPGRPVRTTENDRCRGGRRQERQPRRNDQPARGLGRACARRLRHHGARLPRVPQARGAGQAHPGAAGCTRRRRRARAGRGRRRDPPLGRRDAAAAAAGSGHPRALHAAVRRAPRDQLRGALLGHGRRPARRLVRRPAGDLSERDGIDEILLHMRGLRLAVQRPGDQLPRAQGLRARRCRAVGRRAAHGALRHRQLGRDVHHRHRVRLHRRGVHHQQLRPGRDGGAGRRQPRRVLRAQAGLRPASSR
jgi:hypothetical protein